MAPKRATRSNIAPETTNTTSVTNVQLQAMINQGVTAALVARDADRNTNGDDSHISGAGVRRTERIACECTYTDFLKCQPLNFKGTEGVAGLSQWFERMKSVFHISNYTVENQVKFATCTLHSVALTWWNTHVKTVSHDAAYGELALLCGRMFPEESDKIEKYVDGLPDMIYGRVVASKPKTMQDAVEIATELMDKKIRTFAERQTESKRKSKWGNKTRLNIISCTKTQKYMLKECHVFLAHVTTKKTKDNSEEKRLEDVPIIQDFPKVFPKELLSFPPTRQVEFHIDLIPGAAPVA
ncbi:hypothetical protein Tco_0780449 [Tanacetum coccineum]